VLTRAALAAVLTNPAVLEAIATALGI
jgi:hypothetical protein